MDAHNCFCVLVTLCPASSNDCNRPLAEWLCDCNGANKLYVPQHGKPFPSCVLLAGKPGSMIILLSAHPVRNTHAPYKYMKASILTHIRHRHTVGSGLIEEVNCTWCGAGRYQTGSGLLSSPASWPNGCAIALRSNSFCHIGTCGAFRAAFCWRENQAACLYFVFVLLGARMRLA
jgi:hypothetical protein